MRQYMNKFLYAIAAAFIFLSGNLYAQQDKPFIYEGRDNRDPFVQLVSKDGKFTISRSNVESIGDIALEGIIYDPEGGSVAILNDMALKENDQMAGITVKKIELNKVILSFKDKEYTLKLKEQEDEQK
jgi:hypothetical protein